jgi:signal peptidase II
MTVKPYNILFENRPNKSTVVFHSSMLKCLRESFLLFVNGGNLVFYYGIALLLIIFDQVTKWMVVKNMQLGESITIIEEVLYLTSHRNRGAAWGILQGQMWFFYIITVIVIIGIVYYMQKGKEEGALFKWALSLMLAGAIGNFIDRVLRQEVVDFIHTFPFGYNFPIFNIADSSLVVGVALLIIHMFLEEKKAKKKEKVNAKSGTHSS